MTSNKEITQVRPAHRFNKKQLEGYLSLKLDGFSGVLTKVHQYGYGQSNPTFLLSDGKREYVLRKKPPGKLLPSAHAVEREYRIIRALQDTDVPVPKTHILCEDATVIGTEFYIMEKVNGRIFRDPFAAEVSGKEERSRIFDSMNDTLTRIHMTDWETLGLADFGKTGNYMARQVSRWTRQYESAKTDEIESMNGLIEWLSGNIPSDQITGIVHGDYRLENMIIHAEEPRVIAVLDWELSTLGNPLADLAYNCMGYHLPSIEGVISGLNEEIITELGIPSEEEYVKAYCRRTGREEIPDWGFFLAFSMFRLAAIVQGVYRRGLDGIASSSNANKYGVLARIISDAAWKTVNS